MIDPTAQPIEEALALLGAKPHRGRARGVCHDGRDPDAISYDVRKNVWYCHRCAVGGDAIDLVRLARKCDFKAALSFLGISPDTNQSPTPDPAIVRQREEEARTWAALLKLQRRLREEFCSRGRIEMYGVDRLREDPERAIGWSLLECAYGGLDALENQLDELLEQIPREAYRRAV